MEDGKAARVGLVLSALQKQLMRLPVPYTPQQEEADEHGLCRCCVALAEFTKSLAEEVKKKDRNSLSTAEEKELRSELLKLYVPCRCYGYFVEYIKSIIYLY